MCTYHFLKKKKFVEWICGNSIAEIREKEKLLQLVYGNAIAKIRGEFVAIVTIPLPKMGGKKNSGCQNLGMN